MSNFQIIQGAAPLIIPSGIYIGGIQSGEDKYNTGIIDIPPLLKYWNGSTWTALDGPSNIEHIGSASSYLGDFPCGITDIVKDDYLYICGNIKKNGASDKWILKWDQAGGFTAVTGWATLHAAKSYQFHPSVMRLSGNDIYCAFSKPATATHNQTIVKYNTLSQSWSDVANISGGSWPTNYYVRDLIVFDGSIYIIVHDTSGTAAYIGKVNGSGVDILYSASYGIGGFAPWRFLNHNSMLYTLGNFGDDEMFGENIPMSRQPVLTPFISEPYTAWPSYPTAINNMVTAAGAQPFISGISYSGYIFLGGYIDHLISTPAPNNYRYIAKWNGIEVVSTGKSTKPMFRLDTTSPTAAVAGEDAFSSVTGFAHWNGDLYCFTRNVTTMTSASTTATWKRSSTNLSIASAWSPVGSAFTVNNVTNCASFTLGTAIPSEGSPIIYSGVAIQ